MELSGDEIFKNYGKHCVHCNRKTILPYEYELNCVSCGYNVIKQKNELSKLQRKRINFSHRLKMQNTKFFVFV